DDRSIRQVDLLSLSVSGLILYAAIEDIQSDQKRDRSNQTGSDRSGTHHRSSFPMELPTSTGLPAFHRLGFLFQFQNLFAKMWLKKCMIMLLTRFFQFRLHLMTNILTLQQ